MDFEYITTELNNKFSIDLKKADELLINELILELLANEELKNQIKSYSLDEFKPFFEKSLNKLLAEKRTQLFRFFKKIKEDNSFKNTLMENLLPEIYEKLTRVSQ